MFENARAVLYPAIAEAAYRAGATAVGLIDLGGFNLTVDRVGITYGRGVFLGDPSSPEQLSSRVVRRNPVPARAIPEVVARAGIDADVVSDAIAQVPAGALPVVTTTWALSRLTRPRRERFVDRLGEAASGRAVAWVSVEGVGVAPSVPTLGDRPASGHSIIGLAIFDGSGARAEALGRCWSRGRVLEWLAS